MMKDRYILSDFAEPIAVAIQNAKESHLNRFVGLEHYDSGEPVISRYSDTSLLGSSVKEFHKNDILIARRNVYLKRAGICFFDGLTSGDSIVLRIYNDCEKRTGVPLDLAVKIIPFIVNSNSFWAYANKHADGMNSKRISKEKVLSYEFSLPSLAEQKILADKLWAAYEVKQSYLNMIDATNQMVKAKFAQILSANQIIVPLSEYVWFQEGPGVRKYQFCDSGIKLLNGKNINDGKIDLSTTDKYISESEAFGKYKHFLVDDGDILIASSGIQPESFSSKVGVIKQNQLPLCMNTSTIRFKVKDKELLDKDYFIYYLKSNWFIEQLTLSLTGSVQLNFGPTHLQKMILHLPETIEQQKKFSLFAKNAESSIAHLNDSIIAIDKVIRSLINENL